MSCTVIDWDLVENTFIAKTPSRMRTIRSSGCWWGGGGVCIPACLLGSGVCIPACTGQGVLSQHVLGRGCRIPKCTGHGGCLPRGVSAQGVSARGGMSACGGGCLPQCMLGYTPLCGQNDRRLWKYYLAATTLRTVNIMDENKYVRKCKNSNAVVLEIGNFLWNYSWSRNLFPWWILLSLINRQGPLRPLNLQMENQTISDRSYTM